MTDKARKNLSGLIFSKDRALQLRATLDSFFLHCRDSERVDLNILYKVSDRLYQRQYDALKSEFADVNFITETDFRTQTLALMDACEHILFLVDDNIFVNDFSFDDILWGLSQNTDSLGFSLRLGTNIDFNYNRNQPMEKPLFISGGRDLYKFIWTEGQCDFAYPLEISSSVYRSGDLMYLLKQLDFANPNTFEGYMAANSQIYAQVRSTILCFPNSVTFCNPINLVQTVCKNRAGENQDYSAQKLAQIFDSDMVIDVAAYNGFTPNACHQEVGLKFKNKHASTTCSGEAKPLVTVEMIAYNAESYISRAIESVLNQTYSNFELLIIDDGSDDRTPDIVASYNDTRIRYIRKKHENRWAGTNLALSIAKGQFIIPVDSDDRIDPDYIEAMVQNAIRNPDVDFFYPRKLTLVDEDNVLTGARWEYNDFSDNGLLPPFLFDKGFSPIPYPGSLKRKSMFDRLGGFKEHPNVADFVFLCENALKISFMRVDNHTTYFYRTHSKSLSQNYSVRDRVIADTLNDMVSRYKPDQLYPAIEQLPDIEGRKRKFYKYVAATFKKHAAGFHLVKNGRFFTEYADYYTQLLRSEDGSLFAPTENITLSGGTKPLVSVEMVTYNGRKFIAQAIESVLAQSYEKFELIIVDDGSTDDTPQIISSFTDQRIRYIRQQHKNAATARNTAIANSRGRFVLVVDSDDFIHPDYMRHIVEYAASLPHDDFFYPEKLTLVDEFDNPMNTEWKYPDFTDSTIVIELLFKLGKSPIPNPGSLIRKSLFDRVGGYMNIDTVEDYVFLCKNAMQIKFKKVPLRGPYFYRKINSGLSHRFTARNHITAEALNDMIRTYPPHVIMPELKTITDKNRAKHRYYEYLMLTFYKHAQANRGRYELNFKKLGDHYKACMIEQIVTSGSRSDSIWTRTGPERLLQMFQCGIDALKDTKPDEALVYFDQVYNEQPTAENLNYGRALAFIQLGRDDQAEIACHEELAAWPEHQGAKRILNKIETQVAFNE